MPKIYLKAIIILFLTTTSLKSQLTNIENISQILLINELNRLQEQYLSDIDNFLSLKISRNMPLLTTMGHTDQILSHFSVFGIDFGFSGGVFGALDIVDLQSVEKSTITTNQAIRDIITNLAAFSLPLVTPYVGFRIRIDSKTDPKFFHPFVLSFKYSGTSAIQSSIDQILQTTVNNNQDLLSLDYRIDSLGIQFAFPLWKLYNKDFQLNFSGGYNYLRGEIGVEAETRFDQDISFQEEVLTISNINMRMSYSSLFETSSLDLNLNFSASVRFFNAVFGLGLIISSTTFNSIYSSTAESEDISEPSTIINRQTHPIIGVLPKLNLAFKFFWLLDIAFYVTTQSFAFKISLIL